MSAEEGDYCTIMPATRCALVQCELGSLEHVAINLPGNHPCEVMLDAILH